MTNKSKSPAGDQNDRTMTFNGMTNAPEVSKPNYNTNHWSGHLNDGRDVNFGRGPTRGNASSSPIPITAKGGIRNPERQPPCEEKAVVSSEYGEACLESMAPEICYELRGLSTYSTSRAGLALIDRLW